MHMGSNAYENSVPQVRRLNILPENDEIVWAPNYYGREATIKKRKVLYTSGEIEDVFRCVSGLCTGHGIESPNKSNPEFRDVPPQVRLIGEGRVKNGYVRRKFSIHLPPDLRYLYSAAPLAYYLGASVEIGGRPRLTFKGHEPLRLPKFPDFEGYMGEALRRIFYLDCAVRYATQSGKSVDGIDIHGLFGIYASDIFCLGMEERFLLYMDPSIRIPGLPRWHMASYLEPVPENVEVLPFLLRSLSAIYEPRHSAVSERDVVSMCVKGFLRQDKETGLSVDDKKRAIVVPSLHNACAHLWFAEGFPVDAAKGSARAFANRKKFMRHGRGQVHVGVVCNERAMRREVKVIKAGLASSQAVVKVHRDTSISRFTEVFAHGYDVVQFIGHCDARGFKCSDGFARVSDISVNNTPMFFFNSCSSHHEAARLIEKGSVCGVATLFRVLEEAAMEVCKNFYIMLGAGYPVLTSINAAKECSVLGKEYLLIGDGSFTCFEGDRFRPFYRIVGKDGEYSLQCTVSNIEKGYILGVGRSKKKATSDLGFETRPMPAGQLARVSRDFKGFCLFHRNIYCSVEEAANAAVQDNG